jgi:hypothetical protein
MNPLQMEAHNKNAQAVIDTHLKNVLSDTFINHLRAIITEYVHEPIPILTKDELTELFFEVMAQVGRSDVLAPETQKRLDLVAEYITDIDLANESPVILGYDPSKHRPKDSCNYSQTLLEAALRKFPQVRKFTSFSQTSVINKSYELILEDILKKTFPQIECEVVQQIEPRTYYINLANGKIVNVKGKPESEWFKLAQSIQF